MENKFHQKEQKITIEKAFRWEHGLACLRTRKAANKADDIRKSVSQQCDMTEINLLFPPGAKRKGLVKASPVIGKIAGHAFQLWRPIVENPVRNWFCIAWLVHIIH